MTIVASEPTIPVEVDVRVGPCEHQWSQSTTTGSWSCWRCNAFRRFDDPPPAHVTQVAYTSRAPGEAQSIDGMWVLWSDDGQHIRKWAREPFDGAVEFVRPSARDGECEREAIRDEIINTPETADFMAGVPIEAAHQRSRWSVDHDAGKTPFDWFWLIGYLAQKAASAQVAGDTEKAKHHTISTAAALANWHAQIDGLTTMRPGIDPVERGVS